MLKQVPILNDGDPVSELIHSKERRHALKRSVMRRMLAHPIARHRLRLQGILLLSAFACTRPNDAPEEHVPATPRPQFGDQHPAMNEPDKFAWDLFIDINRPALVGHRGEADPAKTLGDAGLRVWQTWKVTTENGNEVFLENGRDPKGWSDGLGTETLLSAPQFTFLKFDRPGSDPHKQSLVAARHLHDNGQESRINKLGFDYIVGEQLYSLDGQEAFRRSGRRVEFPIGTINVKAAWRRFTKEEIAAQIPRRFYTTTVLEGANKRSLWGLTGLHITSKHLPNWFWATFEHVDNPLPEIPDHDRYTAFLLTGPAAEHRSFADRRQRNVPAPLKNTVWEHYVLRGTQVDFTDAMGNPTILGNTQLEGGEQATSSCIGCHARATIGDRMPDGTPDGTYFYPGGRWSARTGNRLTVNVGQVPWQQDPQKPLHPDTTFFFPTGAIGAPNPEWFLDSGGAVRYTQLDFIWGFIHAQRR